MVEIKRNRIVCDGVEVGFYRRYVTPDVNLNCVLSLFDTECQKAICGLKLPPRFDYIWVSDIAVKPAWRRQGIASRVLNLEKDALIACAPGSGSFGKMRINHEARLAFYANLGFTIIEGKRHDFAFKKV